MSRSKSAPPGSGLLQSIWWYPRSLGLDLSGSTPGFPYPSVSVLKSKVTSSFMRRWKHASRSCGVTKTDYPPALAPCPLRSVKAVGADEVVLDREQEGLVLRELDEAGLRRRV